MSSVGKQIDDLIKLRQQKAAAQATVDEIDEKVKAAEAVLLETLQAEGVEKATGKLGTVSVSQSVVAAVKDWDVFHAYLRKNNLLHVLQRRVSDPAYRELLDLGKKVPGVEPFTKVGLRVTTSK